MRGNIIHRDLKPANVLIAADGTLKVTDFGLVKRLEDDSSQTRTGAILGTPSYMSPEQANGQTHQIGPPADQYALGAILYELLTSRPPFQGTSVLDTLELVRKREPVPPSQLQSKIPRDLETICLKALEKDPARRYGDVAAMAEDLRRFQVGEPIVARPVSPPERLWRWCLRNTAPASSLMAAAGILLIAAIGGTAQAVIITQKNQTLELTNVAVLEKAKDAADEQRKVAVAKQQAAEAAARAANKQNKKVVETEVAWINVMEHKLRYVPEVRDLREQMLADATTTLDDSIRSMTGLRDVVGWDPKDEENNWRTLAQARQRLGDFSLSQPISGGAHAIPPDGRNYSDTCEGQPRRRDGAVPAGEKPHSSASWRRKRLVIGRWGKSTFARRSRSTAPASAKKPGEDTFHRELADSLGQLAAAELVLGHLEKARDLYREEVQVRGQRILGMAGGADEDSRRELASLYEKLAELNFRMNQPKEGRGVLRAGRRETGRIHDRAAGLLAGNP